MAKMVDAIVSEEDNTIFHYEHVSQVPKNIQKYWEQRHDIFSKYDEGIWMTDDAWFGITPEPIANKIASQIATAAPPHTKYLIDAFAGAGGNTVAFARSGRWERVFALELSPATHKCLLHSAQIYGCAGLISARVGDCFSLIPGALKSLLKDAVVFASPPWGGPGYVDAEVFDVQGMQPYGLEKLWRGLRGKAEGWESVPLALYLPRTSDLGQVAGYVREGERVEVTHYCMRGASKVSDWGLERARLGEDALTREQALVAYYGKWDFASGQTDAQVGEDAEDVEEMVE